MTVQSSLHVVHVAGNPDDVEQGTDGMSRGDHGSGVMAGSIMLSFVPSSQPPRFEDITS
jgi:hypothetical protein